MCDGSVALRVRIAREAKQLAEQHKSDAMLSAVLHLLSFVHRYESYIRSEQVTERGFMLLLSVEMRYIPHLREMRPFLRLVQISVPVQSQGHGTRLLWGVERAAALLKLDLLVECVMNERWRRGWFEKRLQPHDGPYHALPESPNCYYIFCGNNN